METGFPKSNSRLVERMRLAARGWAVAVCVLALAVAFTPDPDIARPLPAADRILAATFPGLAIVGLLLACARRWEGLGGALAVVAFVAHLVLFRVYRGSWLPAQVAAVQLVSFVIPALLFMLCWHLSIRGGVETVRVFTGWPRA